MKLHHGRITLDEANAFVAALHRHHPPVVGHLFSLGAFLGAQLVGVVIVGRPVPRMHPATAHVSCKADSANTDGNEGKTQMTDLKRYRLDCADGEWTPYDEAEAALLQTRADAAAAQALMVEQIAGVFYSCADMMTGQEVGDAIRALAPDAGTAQLRALRANTETGGE